MTSSSTSRIRPRRTDVREQVLRAAADAFLRCSYADVSVADVASAAGFTKAAVYSHFGGNTALFAAVLGERFTELVGGVLAAARGAVETRAPADVPHAV